MLGWVVGPMGGGGMVLMFGCFPWGEGDWGIDDDVVMMMMMMI